MARSPRLLFDESKSRFMQVARRRWDVFLLAYEWAGWGGAVKPDPTSTANLSSSPGEGKVGWVKGWWGWWWWWGGVHRDACEPHRTPFVSVLWRPDRSGLYFTISTFHFLYERSRVVSCTATPPRSHRHAFSPVFAARCIYSSLSDTSGVHTLFRRNSN